MNLKRGIKKHSNYGQEIFLGRVTRSVKNLLRTTDLGATAGTTVGIIAAIRGIDVDLLAEDVGKILGQILAILTSLDKHHCYFKLPMFDPTKLFILPLHLKPENAYFESQFSPGVTLRRTL